MSRLDDAKIRLETALKRLEAVSDDCVSAKGMQDSLESATRENKTLLDANEAVSARLGDAIQKLRQLVQD
ncbi:MAG: hypothetical protein JKY20_11180 [Alphaproteobacteria bacterium]|nr:hypothetical protein [Alphaproteobacteria bacterium]